MFCYKCGKQISEGSAFCTWCGAKNGTDPSIPAPAPAPLTEASVQAAEPADDRAVFSQRLYEEPEKPSAIPVSSTPADRENSHVPMMEVPMCDPLPENMKKPKKLYTGGQIALCLVLMGIMAAVAGVFAGLYFSVI